MKQTNEQQNEQNILLKDNCMLTNKKKKTKHPEKKKSIQKRIIRGFLEQFNPIA